MDIIDIMLAKAMSQPADVTKYAQQAKEAATSAAAAADSADAAIASVNQAAEGITEKVTTATELLETAQEALDAAQEAGVTKSMLDEKADKADTVLDTTLSRGRSANTTVGQNSIAFGENVTASGTSSQAYGTYTYATGNNSHAEGYNTQASGLHSHAEGNGTIASGDGAHAEGWGGTASGVGAHSEGGNTTASGEAAHSEGDLTVAGAFASHASGTYNLSMELYPTFTKGAKYNIGDRVTYQGQGRECIYPVFRAGNYPEPKEWKYLPSNTDAPFVIGNGTSSGGRSNSTAFGWEGNAYHAGDVYVNWDFTNKEGNKLTPIPAGGSEGQVLSKNSDTDYDLKWTTPSSSSGGSGSIDFGPENAGQMVVIDENGNAAASEISEEDLITLLTKEGIYNPTGVVGLDIDYANRTIMRIQEATSLNAGSDFNKYPMYGGRMRCNVSDNGEITAFYGDANYKDDGSNGQVMIYQPKFYYQRTLLNIETASKGQIIRHETISISAQKHSNYKLAPIFKDGDSELDYVLFSAYEGGLTDNKLTSIADSKPVAAKTIAEMESYATARGTGWHIENMAAVATNQMLEMVEFGSMNGQQSLELGICNVSGNSSYNCSSITGSTSSLGNTTGAAEATVTEINGSTTTYTVAGKRAISYRGLENPWGNIWKMIGGVVVKGDGKSQGGNPYICTNFNYTPDTVSDNYEDVGFNLPSNYTWINAMGYGNSDYDWVYLPIECSNRASSALPVGDNLWVTPNTTENKIIACGGAYSHQENAGPFYYAADYNVTTGARLNYGARLMYIPTKNATYTANINKWVAKMGA